MSHKRVWIRTCSTCGFVADRHSVMVAHRRTHRDPRVVCPVCDGVFSSRTNLNRHMKRHTRDNPLACDQCDFRTAFKGQLTKHVSESHAPKPPPAKPIAKPSPARRPSPTPTTCRKCGWVAATRDSLREHMRVHAAERPFKCDKCDYWGLTVYEVTQHAIIHQPPNIFCPECDYTTRWPRCLKNHMQHHKREKRIQRAREQRAAAKIRKKMAPLLAAIKFIAE